MMAKTDSPSLGLKQFRVGDCLSYLTFDKASKKAVLVDPCASLTGEYRSYLAESALTLEATVLTRTSLEQNALQLGEISVKILRLDVTTSICWVGGLVFTGDSLLIGAGLSLVASKSVQCLEILRELPRNTVILPGFVENGLLFSTIEKELTLHTPSELSHQFSCISIDKFKNKIEENSSEALFVDVREENEFIDGHIPGVCNIPLSELGLHLSEFSGRRKVYLSCQSGRRSELGAKTLSYLGISDVVNVVGGYQGWMNAGYSSRK